MRQVIKSRQGQWNAASDTAMLRRLQEKWKANKDAFLTDAQQREEARERPVTLADLIETGVLLHAAYRAWQTPENLAKLQLMATNVASMIERITEPVARLQAALAQRPEVLARIAAVSQQIQQINRIAEPVARMERGGASQ